MLVLITLTSAENPLIISTVISKCKRINHRVRVLQQPSDINLAFYFVLAFFVCFLECVLCRLRDNLSVTNDVCNCLEFLFVYLVAVVIKYFCTSVRFKIVQDLC